MRSNLETTSPSSLRVGVLVEKEDDDDVTPMDLHGRAARAWAATAVVVVREAARRSMAWYLKKEAHVCGRQLHMTCMPWCGPV